MKHRTLAISSAVALSLSLLAAGLAPASLANPAAAGGSAAVNTLQTPSPNQRYILRLSTDADPIAVKARLAAVGASVIAFQATLHTVVVKAPASALKKLSGVSGVTAVSPDAEVKAESLGFDYSTQPGSMTNITRTMGATEMWKKGYTGKGVDVALIDTGVAPVSGLLDPNKVVVGPDLSFESQNSNTRYLDTFGHGTNMAGIIAGREVAAGSGASYAADTSNFYGMAPDARIVSLKLADHSGAVDVSQIIAAVDWVVMNRTSNGLNIKVMNISWGTISTQNAQVDPLSWAAEVAWRHGIVVVASAGNDGVANTGLASPAYNPWVIAVGAEDTKGTADFGDDVVPGFSNKGINNGRGPDLVAPGVGIVSLGVPGSAIYNNYPAARVGNGFMRGSGTSQAAAVISGATALVLSQYPWMKPDDIKTQLVNSTYYLANTAFSAQGAGVLDLRKELTRTFVPYAQNQTYGWGGGTLEKARGGAYVQVNGANLTGETDIMGRPWVSLTMADEADDVTAWTTDGQFNGAYWTGGGMATDTGWAGKTWQGKTWQGKTWQGKTWQGKTWQGGTWQGKGWSSAAWTGPVASSAFASKIWSSAAWK